MDRTTDDRMVRIGVVAWGAGSVAVSAYITTLSRSPYLCLTPPSHSSNTPGSLFSTETRSQCQRVDGTLSRLRTVTSVVLQHVHVLCILRVICAVRCSFIAPLPNKQITYSRSKHPRRLSTRFIPRRLLIGLARCPIQWCQRLTNAKSPAQFSQPPAFSVLGTNLRLLRPLAVPHLLAAETPFQKWEVLRPLAWFLLVVA